MIIFGSFFLLNLTLAVIWDEFEKNKDENATLQRLKEAEEARAQMERVKKREQAALFDADGDGEIEAHELAALRRGKGAPARGAGGVRLAWKGLLACVRCQRRKYAGPPAVSVSHPTSLSMQASLASSYLPTLRAGRWFSALAPQFADLLLALAQQRSLETGEALFLRGDALEGGLFAVVRGSIGFSGVGGQAYSCGTEKNLTCAKLLEADKKHNL